MASPQIPLGLEMVDTQTACKYRVVGDVVPVTTPNSSSGHAPGAEQTVTTLEGVRGIQDATEYRGSWLIMQGSVGSKERCPVPGCGATFGPVLITPYGWFPGGEKRRGRKNKNSIANDLGCIEHKTHPRRYFANCRPFVDSKGRNVGRPEVDLHGRPFDSYAAANRHLEAVRKSWEDDKENFDASMWSSKAKAELTFEKFVPEYFEYLKENSQTHHPDNVAAIFKHKLLPRYANKAINSFNRGIYKQLQRELKKEGRDEKGNRIPGLPKGKGANDSEYVKKILKTLRAYLNWLKEEEHIKFVPELPKTKKIRKLGRKWASREVQRKIIVKLGKYSKNAAMEVEVACDTAMRPTHLHAAKKHHIKEDGILIEYSYTNIGQLTETKNGIFDVVPLSSEVFRRLKEHAKDMGDDDYLFIDEEKRRLFTTPRLSYLVSKAAKDADVDTSLYLLVKYSTISQIRKNLIKEAKETIQDKGVWKDPDTGVDYALPTENEIGGPGNATELAPSWEI